MNESRLAVKPLVLPRRRKVRHSLWGGLAFGQETRAVYTQQMEIPIPGYEAVFVAVLLAGVPVLALRLSRATEEFLGRPRLELYRHSMAGLWVLTLATLLLVRFGSLRRLPGLTLPSLGVGALTAISLLAMLLLIGNAFARGEGKSQQVVRKLIPRTPAEKRVFLLLVLTAGFCEEILYRSYLIDRLLPFFASAFWPALLATTAFALAHAYQGGSGVLRAFLMGWVLVAAYFWSGSLIPGMLGHFLVDLMAGFYLGPQWLRRSGPLERELPE